MALLRYTEVYELRGQWRGRWVTIERFNTRKEAMAKRERLETLESGWRYAVRKVGLYK